MKLASIRLGLGVLGNALGLLLAAALLDDMTVSGTAFVVAVIIFTVLIAVLDWVITKVAQKGPEMLQGGSALISTALALLFTSWISDGMGISGAGTWVMATVIVWASALILGVLLMKFVITRFIKD